MHTVPPEAIRRQYFFYLSGYNATRALYISTYSLFLVGPLGLPLSWTPWLLSFNLLVTMASEIPTGAFADLRGRRNSFLLSCALSAIGYLLYAAPLFLSPDRGTHLWLTMGAVLAAEMLLAVGYTFYSGALDSWAVHLGGLTSKVALQRVFSRAQMWKNLFYVLFGVGGVLIFFLCGGSYWCNPFFAAASFSVLLTAHVGLRMAQDNLPRAAEAVAQKRAAELRQSYVAHIGDAVSAVVTDPRVAYLVLAQSASFLFLQLIVFFWPYYLVHMVPHHADLQSSIGSAAVLAFSWMLSYGARAAGSALAGDLRLISSPLKGIALAIAATTLPVLLLFQAPSLDWGFADLSAGYLLALFAYAITRFGDGLGEPLRQVFLNAIIDEGKRATILSIASTGTMLVSALGLGLSSVALHTGLTVTSVWLVAALLQVLTIPLYAAALSKER